MTTEPSNEREPPLDISIDRNGSFQYDALEQSLDVPTFEFSSPISSIGSNCSSPDRERTIQPMPFHDQSESDYSSDDFVSVEDLKSQISPPSDDEYSALGSSQKTVLETIFEDCYLETPPGTPNTPRSKKPRRFRLNLSSFEEFKENVQINNKTPEDNWAIPRKPRLDFKWNNKLKNKDTLCREQIHAWIRVSCRWERNRRAADVK